MTWTVAGNSQKELTKSRNGLFSRLWKIQELKSGDIDQLFRLAAVTGTIRILRGEGGVGGGGSGPYSAWQEKSEIQAE